MTIRCPICEKAFDSAASSALPFCSSRCRTIDLKRWLNEEYSLPIERPEDVDEESPLVPADD